MKINQYIDHTYLKPFASYSFASQDIIETCREAKEYHFASVCVNPCNIRLAAQELGESEVKACSVIGFPFGAHTTAVKLFEAKEAIRNGAEEIDMVINISL